MEKYSKWRDAGTGIQPFLPLMPPKTDITLLATLSNIIHMIVGPILGLIKLLLVTVVFLVYVVIVPGLGLIWSPIPPLKRLWTSIFSRILLRLGLFFVGFFYIKAETVSIRKSRQAEAIKPPSVNNGDVIVANWTSYIDIIYLAARYNPIFTQIYLDTTNVKPITLWEAIRLTAQIPASRPNQGDKLYTVKELSSLAKKKKMGPIVIFAEGTTSNGRALLKFAPLFKEYKQQDQVNNFRIVSFKYEYNTMPPTYTVGNQFIHFFHLCSEFHNSMIVKTLAQGEDPTSGTTVNTEDPVGDSLITSLSHVSKLRKTNLSMADKCDFLSYYESRNQKKSN
ncbi:hypothetical protein BDB01DRAFT_785608 [Pilobolus umbonatus]|nr:hypothetical protein BDB01DRAFT_785608 [Pilobolus umbonatus]